MDSERAAVYTAALEQSEQLWRAAREVGAAARPLPLFYCLSQAGRAIAAAYLPGTPWRLAGHGLRMDPRDSAEDPLKRGILPRAVHDERRRDSVSGVAAATGSGSLSLKRVELGEVWAAIPDLIPGWVEQFPMIEPDWRRPWIVWDESEAIAAQGGGIFGGVPPWPSRIMIGGTSPGWNVEKISEELKRYPALSGAVVQLNVAGSGDPRDIARGQAPTGEQCPLVGWDLEPPEYPKLWDIARPYRAVSLHLAVPMLGGVDYVSPLLLWWILLFGLSNFARYEPELWMRALDINASMQATPIEAALDMAIEALPDLILAALCRENFLDRRA